MSLSLLAEQILAELVLFDYTKLVGATRMGMDPAKGTDWTGYTVPFHSIP